MLPYLLLISLFNQNSYISDRKTIVQETISSGDVLTSRLKVKFNTVKNIINDKYY